LLFVDYSILDLFTPRSSLLPRYDAGVEEEDLDNPHAGRGGMGHGGIPPEMMHMFMRVSERNVGGRFFIYLRGGHLLLTCCSLVCSFRR
jgi:hypothetical protein